MNKRSLYEIKVEEVEEETWSVDKPSSPHIDSLGDAQSFTGDAQTTSDVDP